MSSTSKVKIAHLSSAHPDLDVRIFYKECVSLANSLDVANTTLDVHLILSGVEERKEQNVTIHSVEKETSRIKRMWNTVNRVYKKAMELDADIYHLHDPELLRIALKLKRKGKIVIYDAHEDLPRQLQGKAYLKFKNTISGFFEWYENRVVRKLDGVVTATPFIRDRFLKVNKNTIDINNFPLASEIEFSEDVEAEKENKVCFIGGISKIRGISYLVDAFENLDVELDLAGGIAEDFKVELEKSKGWKNVNDLGFINRQESLRIKNESFAGIVTFLGLPNHVNAQPNKIFEYMASGLPVIGSNFPLWKEIIEKNKCGICIDPESPEEIAQAIKYLEDHPDVAKEMGANGKRIVRQKYNWAAEEIKLIHFYQRIILKQ
ncbi:MAG: glycosyltransferase family 4 protein [Flavobacteriia bacterium]|jgi:glycosyltransferase involved in cell wall biosynthesis|nr:glycosyltransferase family 4 protein [Cryomorphaceae bacterium]